MSNNTSVSEIDVENKKEGIKFSAVEKLGAFTGLGLTALVTSGAVQPTAVTYIAIGAGIITAGLMAARVIYPILEEKFSFNKVSEMREKITPENNPTLKM